MDLALADVGAERTRQEAKWGSQHHDPVYWLGIIMEEVGEAAKEAIELRPMAERGLRSLSESTARLRTELIHVAACAVACIEDIDLVPLDGVTDEMRWEAGA